MSILDQLALSSRDRLRADMASICLADMKAMALHTENPQFRFEKALLSTRLSFICEVKKASPSKGLIAPDFDFLTIAGDYQAGGAAAISVLTEPTYFLGSNEHLRLISASVDVPVLRKDFTVDVYQVYQARALGASAVLLICALLDDAMLAQCLQVGEQLGMTCLVEAHDANEVARAVALGASVIGVNNRNLHDFSVDPSHSASLIGEVPEDIAFVWESGLATPADAAVAARSGADAVLVGEALMRAHDRRGLLREFRAAVAKPVVKICGIRDDVDVAAVNAAKPDYAGFVFAPSNRREVTLRQALSLRQAIDQKVATVGVFVDADILSVVAVVRSGAVSAVQLHGHENTAYVDQLRRQLPGVQVIKALGMLDGAVPAQVDAAGADYLLLDGLRPGTGTGFNWSVLASADLTSLPPVLLAGGLTPQNVGKAVRVGVAGVDVSSGVERDGHKDLALVCAFVDAARAAAQEGPNR